MFGGSTYLLRWVAGVTALTRGVSRGVAGLNGYAAEYFLAILDVLRSGRRGSCGWTCDWTCHLLDATFESFLHFGHFQTLCMTHHEVVHGYPPLLFDRFRELLRLRANVKPAYSYAEFTGFFAKVAKVTKRVYTWAKCKFANVIFELNFGSLQTRLACRMNSSAGLHVDWARNLSRRAVSATPTRSRLGSQTPRRR